MCVCCLKALFCKVNKVFLYFYFFTCSELNCITVFMFDQKLPLLNISLLIFCVYEVRFMGKILYLRRSVRIRPPATVRTGKKPFSGSEFGHLYELPGKNFTQTAPKHLFDGKISVSRIFSEALSFSENLFDLVEPGVRSVPKPKSKRSKTPKIPKMKTGFKKGFSQKIHDSNLKFIFDKFKTWEFCKATEQELLRDTLFHEVRVGSRENLSTLLTIINPPKDLCDSQGRPMLVAGAERRGTGALEAIWGFLGPGDATVSDVSGDTAMHAAAFSGNEGGILFLMERGGNLNAKNLFSETPLILATWDGHFDTIITLIRLGADPTICDANNKTPFVHAMDNGYLFLANYLFKQEIFWRENH